MQDYQQGGYQQGGYQHPQGYMPQMQPVAAYQGPIVHGQPLQKADHEAYKGDTANTEVVGK